jgi:hypothetical protein
MVKQHQLVKIRYGVLTPASRVLAKEQRLSLMAKKLQTPTGPFVIICDWQKLRICCGGQAQRDYSLVLFPRLGC